MSSLRQTIDSLIQEGDDYVIDAPEQWAQGRTLYGGMTAALSYGALKRAHGDLGLLRSAQFSFVGPAAGRLRLRSNVLRRGRASATVCVDCYSKDGLAARSMFTFGGARESQVIHTFMPTFEAPPPEQCEPFHKTSKPLPGFLGQFEFRLAVGARLFEPEKPPEFGIWTRFRDDDEGDGVAALLALADAIPCAAMANFPKPAAVSTMSWSLDLVQPLAANQGWRLIWSSSVRAADGYSLQNMRVYSQAGELLADARQVVAIFI